MKFFLLSVLMIGVISAGSADSSGSWKFLGPSGGSFGRILFDPVAGRVVYAQGGDRFSGGPLLRSTNSGLTWNNLNIEGEARIHPRTGLLLVYSSSDLKFSTDRGRTWRTQELSLPIPYTGLDVEFDSQNQKHLYYLSDRGIFISRDGGRSFSKTSNFPMDSCPELEVSRSNGNIAYAYGSGRVIKKTTNGGQTWFDRPLPREPIFCNSMAIDPVNPDVVFLGADRKIVKTTDGGKHWTSSSLNCDYNPPGIAIDQKDPEEVFVTCTHVVQRSTNGGSTWSALVTVPAGGLPGVLTDSFTALSVDPHRNLILLNVMPQGIMRSEDTGKSWRSSNRGLANLSIGNIESNPNSSAPYFAAATDLRKLLYQSADQGRTWRLEKSTPYVMASDTLAMSPSDPSVLASHRSDQFSLTTDAGKTWEKYTTPYINHSRLAFDPKVSSVVYLAGTNYRGSAGFEGVGVAKSTDSGKTWNLMNQDLTDKNIWALAIDPSNQNRLLVESNSGKVFQNTGSGSWTLLSSALPVDIAHSIAISPVDPNLVYLALYYQGTFRSTDGGKTWSSISKNVANVSSFWGIFPDPLDRNTVYAPYGSQIYVSRNAGDSWETAGSSLPYVNDISFIPDGLLAATRSGVFLHSR